MKLSTLFALSTLICFTVSCGPSFDEYYEEDYYEEEGYYPETEEVAYTESAAYPEYQDQSTPKAQFVSNRGGGIVMHPITDPKSGMVSGYIPLPSNWQIMKDKIAGPNGIEVRNYPGGGLPHARSIDQVIQQNIAQLIQQGGAQYLNTINLPEVAANDQRMYAQYWKAMPSQEFHQASGVEIRGPEGNNGLIVVHFVYTQSQYGSFGYYYLNLLSAPPAAYEQAKKHYLFGLANQKVTPQYVAAHNQREQQKSQASWSAHNQRMANNQAAFDSWNRTQKTLSEINDISMEGWRSRNQSSDRMQERAVDGIWEREAVTNPYQSGQVKVESGYKYYYMNQSGEYIGTNNEFYNPAQDPNVNNQEWRKVEKQDYRY